MPLFGVGCFLTTEGLGVAFGGGTGLYPTGFLVGCAVGSRLGRGGFGRGRLGAG